MRSRLFGDNRPGQALYPRCREGQRRRAQAVEKIAMKQLVARGFARAVRVILPLVSIQIAIVAQDQPKPLIKVLVRGATITNTRNENVPGEKLIADILARFPENRRLFERVTLDVIESRGRTILNFRERSTRTFKSLPSRA